MLKLRRRPRPIAEQPIANGVPLAERPDLQIGRLLDDPRLRAAMGLDNDPPTPAWPEPRFDRRRLLESAAA